MRSLPRSGVPIPRGWGSSLLLLVAVLGGCGEGPEEEPGLTLRASAEALARIEARQLWVDVSVLSADSMEGRAPGTVGEARAVRYISQRFREMGLEPVGEDYALPIELLSMTKESARSFARLTGPAGPLDLIPGENFTFWSTSEKPEVVLDSVPVLFVGYGVDAPEYGWDDYMFADVEGKILLFLNDDPPVVEDGVELFGGSVRTYYGRWTYKFEQAHKRGAAGAIVIHTDASAGYGFNVVGTSGERPVWQRDYSLDFLAWMDSTQTERLVAGMGLDLETLQRISARRDFAPVDTGFRLDARVVTRFDRVRAPNVVGRVRGTDPLLADEYLVFTAHHDHLGVDLTLPGPDQIYNGALDNALGVAGLLALAEAFQTQPARRSALFVSVTAEEGGLLGSGRFVEDPPVPLRQVVANFNVDSPQSYGVTADVAAIGLEMSTLGDAFARVVRAHGFHPAGDPDPSAGSFYRSDQLSFAKAGIPALYLQAGREYLSPLSFDPDAHRAERYHQVGDEITDEWDLSGAERDLRLLFEAALQIGDHDEAPRWIPGHEFEAAWRALYRR